MATREPTGDLTRVPDHPLVRILRHVPTIPGRSGVQAVRQDCTPWHLGTTLQVGRSPRAPPSVSPRRGLPASRSSSHRTAWLSPVILSHPVVPASPVPLPSACPWYYVGAAISSWIGAVVSSPWTGSRLIAAPSG